MAIECPEARMADARSDEPNALAARVRAIYGVVLRKEGRAQRGQTVRTRLSERLRYMNHPVRRQPSCAQATTPSPHGNNRGRRVE